MFAQCPWKACFFSEGRQRGVECGGEGRCSKRLAIGEGREEKMQLECNI